MTENKEADVCINTAAYIWSCQACFMNSYVKISQALLKYINLLLILGILDLMVYSHWAQFKSCLYSNLIAFIKHFSIDNNIVA